MATSTKLRQLETLLRDRGFGRALPLADKPVYAPLPTGRPKIDRQIGGGLPRGAISEVLGPQSSGLTGIVFSALAQATQAGEVAAYVDATDCLDPRSAEQAGIVLERLLWVRCDARERPRYERLREQPVDQAWQAVNLIAAAGGFGLADLGGLSLRKLREWQRRPWVRLRQAIENTTTALTVLAERHVAGGAITVELGTRDKGQERSYANPRPSRGCKPTVQLDPRGANFPGLPPALAGKGVDGIARTGALGIARRLRPGGVPRRSLARLRRMVDTRRLAIRGMGCVCAGTNVSRVPGSAERTVVCNRGI